MLWEMAAKQLKRSPGTFEMLAGGKQLPKIGQVIKRPALAHTLRLIQSQGERVFYRGEIAQKIAKTMRLHHGVMNLADLHHYKAIMREPLADQLEGFYFIEPSSAILRWNDDD